MNETRWITALFGIAALYDAVLGALFLVAPLRIFDWFDVTPPNHVGYAQFPAALLLVFVAMFAVIARDPPRHRSLIPYGVGLKASYCLVAGGHWMTGGIPSMWKPFVIVDLAMLVLFLVAYTLLGTGRVEALPNRVE